MSVASVLFKWFKCLRIRFRLQCWSKRCEFFEVRDSMPLFWKARAEGRQLFAGLCALACSDHLLFVRRCGFAGRSGEHDAWNQMSSDGLYSIPVHRDFQLFITKSTGIGKGAGLPLLSHFLIVQCELPTSAETDQVMFLGAILILISHDHDAAVAKLFDCVLVVDLAKLQAHDLHNTLDFLVLHNLLVAGLADVQWLALEGETP